MPSPSVFGVVADSLSFTFGATSAVVHYCDLQAGFAPLPSDMASATVTRGHPDTGCAVPGVIRGARHYNRSAITKAEKASSSSASGTFLIQRPAGDLVGRPLYASAPAVVVEPVREVAFDGAYGQFQ